MSNLYIIKYQTLFKQSTNDEVFFGLVKGEESQIKQLCEKLSYYKSSDINDYYQYAPAKIKVLGNGDSYFKVFTTKIGNGLYLEQPEKMHIIKDNKQDFIKKIDNQNSKRVNEMIGYEEIKILSIKEAWELYVSNMKIS